MSRQGYYAWRRRKPCRRRHREEELRRRIHAAFADSGARYGAPRVYRALVADGYTERFALSTLRQERYWSPDVAGVAPLLTAAAVLAAAEAILQQARHR